MNRREISDYKIKIIQRLLSCDDIIELLDPSNEFEYPDDMIYDRIFPFGRIPGTEQEVKTYITVSIDIPSVGASNDLVCNPLVTIRIVTHADLMKVKNKSGTRIDLLSAHIDELLNDGYAFGIGRVQLILNKECVLDSKHFYREMQFQTTSLNSRRYGA